MFCLFNLACSDSASEAPPELVDAAAPAADSTLLFEDRASASLPPMEDAGAGGQGGAGDADAAAQPADAMVEADEDVDCTPSPEICNGLDDDCDKIFDEATERDGEACTLDLPGLCRQGALSCMSGELVCTPAVEPVAERCDGADNDCDGTADEGLDGAMCEAEGLGRCGVGAQLCVEGRYVCEAPMPTAERCNGIDDDCDGVVDNLADGRFCGCSENRPTLQMQPSCGEGGYEPSSHIGACAIETELHIVGQYESADDGETEVEVSRSAAPIVLVLSSYEPTSWRLNLAPGTQLRQVIINGYEPSVLENQPDGVEVIDLTGPGRYLSACSYVWPGDDQGCDTGALVRGAEARTGLTLTSFQGCYSGAGFVLRDLVQP